MSNQLPGNRKLRRAAARELWNSARKISGRVPKLIIQAAVAIAVVVAFLSMVITNGNTLALKLLEGQFSDPMLQFTTILGIASGLLLPLVLFNWGMADSMDKAQASLSKLSDELESIRSDLARLSRELHQKFGAIAGPGQSAARLQSQDSSVFADRVGPRILNSHGLLFDELNFAPRANVWSVTFNDRVLIENWLPLLRTGSSVQVWEFRIFVGATANQNVDGVSRIFKLMAVLDRAAALGESLGFEMAVQQKVRLSVIETAPPSGSLFRFNRKKSDGTLEPTVVLYLQPFQTDACERQMIELRGPQLVDVFDSIINSVAEDAVEVDLATVWDAIAPFRAGLRMGQLPRLSVGDAQRIVARLRGEHALHQTVRSNDVVVSGDHFSLGN